MKNRRGFSLVELMVTIAILTVIISAIYAVLISSTKAYRTGVAKGKMEDDARLMVERIASLLTEASLATVDGNSALGGIQQPIAPAGSSEISFQPSQGTDGNGNLVLGNLQGVFWQMDAGESDNGIDDDGDGLIDEGQVFFGDAITISTADWGYNVAEFLEGETAGDLIDNNGNGLVDERGLSFQLSGSAVIVRMTIQTTDDNGALMQATVQTTVVIRNP